MVKLVEVAEATAIRPFQVVSVPEGTPPEQDVFVERALELISDRMLGDGSPAAAAGGGTSAVPGGGVIVSYDPRGQLQAAV